MQTWTQTSPPPFRHKIYLGWITDLATKPDTKANWPSIRLDAQMLRDYEAAFILLKQLGFNAVTIWGLAVGRAWPTKVEAAVNPARGKNVDRLLSLAHGQGLKVYAGLGVYSWGFETIIKENPQVARGNPRAMCASEPRAWEFMRRVVDFTLTRLALDGVSMQSADQGRCSCDDCKKYSDAEYHALLNVRVANYVRSRYPNKTIGVNSWGMQFDDPANLPSLVAIGKHVDYLIDVHDTSRKTDANYRKNLIQSLTCDFGTLGGAQVEPPLHWARDRWFLPTIRNNSQHIQILHNDGGRACEYFFHIAANPGDEITTHVAGKMLSDPQSRWETHLQTAIESLYQPKTTAARDDLAALFLRAENAYLSHQPANLCGTISLEPLESDHAGPPLYLQSLNENAKLRYVAELQTMHTDASKFLPNIGDKKRIGQILTCLRNTINDVASTKDVPSTQTKS